MQKLKFAMLNHIEGYEIGACLAQGNEELASA
jgi:hypothetical protein